MTGGSLGGSRDDWKDVSRAQRSAKAVRCRPGIVTNTEFGKAPDQRRTTSLTLVLRRIRGTARYGFIPAGATWEFFRFMASRLFRTRPEAFASSTNWLT